MRCAVTQLVVEAGKSLTCGSDWNLDFIEVTDVVRGHTYKWQCGQWFNSKDGLKKEWAVDKMVQGVTQPLTLVEARGGGWRTALALLCTRTLGHSAHLVTRWCRKRLEVSYRGHGTLKMISKQYSKGCKIGITEHNTGTRIH